MDAVRKHLFTPYGLMLNAPPYTKIDDGIGFITRVYPGIKENGAIFSHPNPWAWAAECMLGRGDKAKEYYDALSPYNQNELIEIRQSEPYSYCQFIMGSSHTAFGRARHPFMTGSAGWAYFSATRYMLGIRPEYSKLTVDPCIPADWDGFEVNRTWRDARYEIRVKNPEHVKRGIARILLNGREVPYIPQQAAGSVCRAEVIM
jgi:N,N'-diacetylchitobiose phosphorylase